MAKLAVTRSPILELAHADGLTFRHHQVYVTTRRTFRKAAHRFSAGVDLFQDVPGFESPTEFEIRSPNIEALARMVTERLVQALMLRASGTPEAILRLLSRKRVIIEGY